MREILMESKRKKLVKKRLEEERKKWDLEFGCDNVLHIICHIDMHMNGVHKTSLFLGWS